MEINIRDLGKENQKNLVFERVYFDENDKVKAIHEILKSNGINMFKKQGLSHWLTPYPIDSIQKNCKDREVFIVRELDKNQYIHTFQLEFSFHNSLESLDETTEVNNGNENLVTICKFATVPDFAGKGIGKKSIEFIESYCRERNVLKLCLDVYEKSEHAIIFYQNRGFQVVDRKPTRNFYVLLMEKQLS